MEKEVHLPAGISEFQKFRSPKAASCNRSSAKKADDVIQKCETAKASVAFGDKIKERVNPTGNVVSVNQTALKETGGGDSRPMSKFRAQRLGIEEPPCGDDVKLTPFQVTENTLSSAFSGDCEREIVSVTDTDRVANTVGSDIKNTTVKKPSKFKAERMSKHRKQQL